MKKTLLTSLLLGSCSIAPIAAIAGGVDVIAPPAPPRVDIPDMREGWGFAVEGSALRGYNNNLNYFFADSLTTVTDGLILVEENNEFFKTIAPNYAFGLRVQADYTLADSANVLKLSYEHLFHRTASNSTAVTFAPELINNVLETVDAVADGSVKLQLDGVTLVSEQHILIGPYWETTLTGGARFAHISQTLNAGLTELGHNTSGALIADLVANEQFTMQFNGVGPLAGFGTMFHVTESIALGAEAQGALLMGRNKINGTGSLEFTGRVDDLTHFNNVTDANSEHIYSVVPEMFYRIYGNYFYRFNDGSELQVEAGWRANQFFNLRTFDDSLVDFAGNTALISVDSSQSDDIGFSGPYLMVHYKL